MEKVTKKAQVNGTKAVFNQSIKGGKLPGNFEVYIKTTIDFEGAQLKDLYECCASGQSARVQLQAQLRAKSVEELNRLAEEGLTVKFSDIIAGKVSKPVDRLMALSREAFIELMVTDLGFEPEAAEAVYIRKHQLNSPEMDWDSEEEDEEVKE